MNKKQNPRLAKKGIFLPLPTVYELMETALRMYAQGNSKEELSKIMAKAIEEKGSDGSAFWIVLKPSTSGLDDLKNIKGVLKEYVVSTTFMLRLWTAKAFLTGDLASEVAVAASDVEDMLLSDAPLVDPVE